MNKRPGQSKNAFTLLELLVAMSIMAVITTAMYSTLYIAFRAKDSLENAITPFADINAVFDVIRSDLACAIDPEMSLSGAFVGEESAINDNSSISFYTSNYIPGEDEIACDVYQTEYSLEKYDQWDGYALVKRSATNLLSQSEVESRTEILCRGILSFEIEYYDGASWTTSWDSENMTYTLLPPLVKITIEKLVDKEEYPKNKSVESKYQQDRHQDYKSIIVSRQFLIPQPPAEEEEAMSL